MHAIVIDGDKLGWQAVDAPSLGAGEVRIKVAATAVNRADLVQRHGGYPPPPGASDILGLECSGTVIELGEGVTRVSIGDEVCALLSGGGYAEEVVVAAGQVQRLPKGFDLVQGAAIPEVFATAYLNLFMEAGLTRGERVLLHAGASGVGTAAIGMCKAMGNPCYVTVGSQDKLDQCIALGASGGSIRHDGPFAEQVAAWTDDKGFDVILDPVGANYLADNLASLSLEGRLVLIGLMGGAAAEINLGLLLMKRLRVIGSTLRARSVAAKSAVMDELLRNIWPRFESGEVKTVVDTVLPIAEADAAHQLMAADKNVGKIVLQVG